MEGMLRYFGKPLMMILDEVDNILPTDRFIVERQLPKEMIRVDGRRRFAEEDEKPLTFLKREEVFYKFVDKCVNQSVKLKIVTVTATSPTMDVFYGQLHRIPEEEAVHRRVPVLGKVEYDTI